MKTIQIPGKVMLTGEYAVLYGGTAVMAPVPRYLRLTISEDNNRGACSPIVEEALRLAALHENIVVKIAMTEEGLKAVSELAKKGVKTNVTLVFSANQALLAAKAGARYVSPFIGRLDDAGQTGMILVQEILEIFENYDFDTEVLVASVRHPVHVIEAARLGAPVITVPPAVLEKMFKHPLTDAGIKRFDEDWKKVLAMGS